MEKKSKMPSRVFFLGTEYLGDPMKMREDEASGMDDVDKMKKEDFKRRIARVKEFEADIYLKQREKELKDAEDKMSRGEQPQSQTAVQGLNLSVDDALKISQLPEDQQNKVMQTIALWRASSADKSGGLAMILPFLLTTTQAPATQQLSPAQLLDLMIRFNEHAKSTTPEQRSTMMEKLLTETIPNLYKDQITDLRGQIQSPTEYVKGVSQAAEALGFKRPGEADSTHENVAMARLTMEDKWKQMDWSYKMDELKTRRTFGYIDSVLKQVNPQRLIKDAAREIFKEKTVVQPRVNPSQAQSGQMQPILTYKCGQCGAMFAAPADQTSAVCAVCGTQYPDLALAASKARSEGGQPSEEGAGTGESEGSSGEGGDVRV